MNVALELTEEERQLNLLALALTALLRPGFDYALGEIATKLEKPGESSYANMKFFNQDQVKPVGLNFVK